MNHNYFSSIAILWVLALGVGGCGEVAQNPAPTPIPTPTPVETSSPIPSPTSAPSPSNPSVEPSPTPVESPRTANPSGLEIGSVSEIEGDISCSQTGGILVYAETENYLVYICADENNPTQPRYYRSFSRDGTPGLTLEATDYDPRQLRYFEFKNGDYKYLLQIPTGAISNPALTVELPDGSYVEERITRYLTK
ncbi:MAG: hypothetical protein WBD58_11305 [Geitlerinemataceae cyanobacterium]